MTCSGEVQNIHYGDILTKFGDVVDCSKEEIPFVADKSKLGKKISYLQNGDIIIADTAEDDAVGKATEILNIQTPVVSGLHTMACRPQFEFEPRFLGYYINSACYHNQLYPFMQGVKVTSVSKGNIALTEIHYPANDEQHKIASMLALIDARIEKQRTLIESLKLYKRGVSEAIFSKKINFGCSNASWDFYTMEDLGYFYNGLSGKGKGDFGTGNSEFITYMNVYKNPISEITMCEVVNVSENEKQNKVQYGDVLFSQSSETLEEVGMSSVWLHETTPYLNSFCFGFRFHNPENIYPLYIAYYMRSQEIRRGIMREGQGATRINLSAERMKGLQLALPDIESQKKIGNFLFCFDKQIINAEAILNETLELRKSLLQKMFI